MQNASTAGVEPAAGQHAWLDAILDTMVDGVVTIDHAGTVLSVNRAAERMFGYAAREMVGRNVSMLMTEPDASCHDAYLARHRAGDSPRIIGKGREVQGRRKDGSVFPLDLAVSETQAGGRSFFTGILRDVSERHAARQQQQRQNALLAAISHAQSRLIDGADAGAAFNGLLADVLDLTNSEYGFIGEILTSPEGAPYLKTHAITNIAWDEATRSFYDTHAAQGMEFRNLRTLFGEVIRTGQSVIANEPAADPRRGGLPPGHPPLNAFLGLPYHHGGKMLGMVGLANRPGGYDGELVAYLETFLSTCASLTMAIRREKRRQEAEERLRESEERYRSLVSTMAEGIVVQDREGRILSCNASAMRILGMSAANPMGRDGARLRLNAVREDGTPLPAGECPAAVTLRTGQPCRHEVMGIPGARGLVTWVSVNAQPIVRPGETLPFAAISSFHDITQLKRSEEALRRVSDRLQLALRAGHFGVWEWSVQTDALDWDARMFELFGVDPAEFGGQLDDWRDRVHPEDLPAAEQALEAALDGGDFIAEFRVLHGDGSLRHIRAVGLLQCDESGMPLRMTGLNWDVTEEKGRERALRHAEQRLSLAAGAAGLGLWEWNIATGETYFDPRWYEMTGYRPEDLPRIVQSWSTLQHPDDEQATARALSTHLRGESSAYRARYRLLTKSGNWRWIQDDGVVVERDARGAAVRMVGSYLDVTEQVLYENRLKEAKEAAESASRAKSDFLANMSHEIRTPMNAILGMAHLALQSPLQPRQRDYVSKIDASAHSLLRIINDILDFSKVEAGRLELESVEFRLSEVLENVASTAIGDASNKRLEVVIHSAADIPPVLVGDPLRLGQVLINLANNAIKFTDSGEVVLTVALDEVADGTVGLRFCVRDTGIGMTEEERSRLFTAFSQADTSTTRRFGGTGLGLAICKRLVGMMGGGIDVVSEPGKGSTFKFTARFGIASAGEEVRPSTASLAGRRVLVADDSRTARAVLQQHLTALGAVTGAVESAEDACVELARARREDGAGYDVVLMDFRMDGMDGVEATSCIKAAGLAPHVVMVTAGQEHELADRATKAGADAILHKPVMPARLADTLMGLWDAKRPAADQGKPAPAAARPSFTGARVLLVEDNAINREVAEELLALTGAQVSHAQNGVEALQRLEAEPQAFDLVLMDVQMPIMDGCEATRRIRARWGAAPPIVAMTANALCTDREACLAAGMDDYLTKPIAVRAFYTTLERWLKRDDNAEAEVAGEPPDGLPQIPGFDVPAAVARLGGDVRLYLRLLESFSREFTALPAQMEGWLASGNLVDARRSAHTLKGVAGTVGAGALSSAAAEFDQAIRADQRDRLPSLASALTAELQSVLARIDAALGADHPAPVARQPAFDRETAAVRAEELAEALAANNLVAASRFQAFRDAVAGVAEGARLAELGSCVDRLDYRRASAMLEGLSRRLGLVSGAIS